MGLIKMCSPGPELEWPDEFGDSGSFRALRSPVDVLQWLPLLKPAPREDPHRSGTGTDQERARDAFEDAGGDENAPAARRRSSEARQSRWLGHDRRGRGAAGQRQRRPEGVGILSSSLEVAWPRSASHLWIRLHRVVACCATSHPMLIHVHFLVHESFTAGIHHPAGKSAM